MLASLTEPLGPTDPDIKRVAQEIAEQKKIVRRMIVQGTPTQAAEDRLRQLEKMLQRLRA
jgi:hypothetical protein